MKLFAFTIDSLKKWWGDKSSFQLLRGFFPVIWHGLRITLIYGGLRALAMLAHKSTGLRKTDAALLSRDIKLFSGIVPRGLGLLLMLFSVQNAMADTTWFITKWQTTTANEDIIIPVNSSLSYSYNIDCDNDGIFELG